MVLANTKIQWKLAGGFGLIVLLFFASVVIAWIELGRLDAAVTETLDESVSMRMAQSVMATADQMTLKLSNMLFQKDPALRAQSETAISMSREEGDAVLQNLKNRTKGSETETLLRSFEAAIVPLKQAIIKAQKVALAGRDTEATALYVNECAPAESTLNDASFLLVVHHQKRLDDLTQAVLSQTKTLRQVFVGGALFVLAVACIVAVLITRGVAIPIRHVVADLGLIAKGDLRGTVQQSYSTRRDEIGELTRAVQTTVQNLQRVVRDIGSGVQTLSSSSQALSSVANETTDGVNSMSQMVVALSAAAGKATSNTTDVAAQMRDATSNLTSVAGATEEMSITIGEVARHASQARSISSDATSKGLALSSTMNELGEAARDIGKITEAITDISSQTNLLALNATIEAARAGSAGKGFGVVANEIKELARQTAAATEDIKRKVASVQRSSTGAMTGIETIAEVLKEINTLITAIATSIEEQATVTKNVATNVAQASTRVLSSVNRVAETADVSRAIAHDIGELNATAVKLQSGGERVQTNAVDLSGLAQQLNRLVGQFTT